MEQLASVVLYEFDSGKPYTSLHRCLNTMKYLENLGADRDLVYRMAGQFFGPSYAYGLEPDVFIGLQVNPTSCGMLIPLYRAVCSRFNILRHLPHQEFVYAENVVEWEQHRMLPKYQPDRQYDYGRSYVSDLYLDTEIGLIKSEFYDRIQVLLRRFA